MTASFTEICMAIGRERIHQRKQWPLHQTQDLGRWIIIMRGELAEAEAEIGNGNDAAALCEILQVAATAIAAIEAHGLHERTP